jgi:hypothetical protein
MGLHGLLQGYFYLLSFIAPYFVCLGFGAWFGNKLVAVLMIMLHLHFCNGSSGQTITAVLLVCCYITAFNNVRFKVFTKVTMKNVVFWDVSSCRRSTRRYIPEDELLHSFQSVCTFVPCIAIILTEIESCRWQTCWIEGTVLYLWMTFRAYPFPQPQTSYGHISLGKESAFWSRPQTVRTVGLVSCSSGEHNRWLSLPSAWTSPRRL